MALLFAATYPERVTALVLSATLPDGLGPDSPEGIDPQEAETFFDQIEESWGHGRVWPLIATQDAPDDEAARRNLAAWSATQRLRLGCGGRPVRPAHRRSPP